MPQETASAPVEQHELESLGPSSPADHDEGVTLRYITGNPFAGALRIERETLVQPQEGETICAEPGGGTVLVQLLEPGFTPITIAVPAAPRAADDDEVGPTPSRPLVTRRAPRARCRQPPRPLSDAGLVLQAAETLESPHLDAEELLRGKMADPIAAAVGAYALLRFANLERLHDWTQNLCNHFPDLADAAAIRGEHLARLGEHSQALELFVALSDRGLPAFTDGLCYALDRLRLYLEVGDFELATLERAGPVFDVLKRLAPIVDYGKPVLTMTADPIKLLETADT